MKKIIIFIIPIILCLILGTIGFIEKNKEKTTQTINTLIVYINDEGNLCIEKTETCKKVYKELPFEDESATIIDLSLNKYILVKGKSLEVIDIETNKIHATEEEVFGLTYENESSKKLGYYNIKTEQYLYEEKYKIIEIIDKNYAQALYQNNYYLISLNEEKEILKLTNINETEPDNYVKTSIYYNNENEILITNPSSEHTKTGIKLYSLKNDEAILINDDIDDISVNDQNIYTLKDKILTIYNFEGEKIKIEDLKDNNINFLTLNYLVIKKNNQLKLLNLDTKEEIELIEMSNSYYFSNVVQGYKESGLHEDNKNKKGIYIVLDDTKNNEKIEVLFNVKTKKVEIYDIEN